MLGTAKRPVENKPWDFATHTELRTRHPSAVLKRVLTNRANYIVLLLAKLEGGVE